MFRFVVLAVDNCVTLWTHPGFAFLFKASAASVMNHYDF